MCCGMRMTQTPHISPEWFTPAVWTGQHFHTKRKHLCVLSRWWNSSQICGSLPRLAPSFITSHHQTLVLLRIKALTSKQSYAPHPPHFKNIISFFIYYPGSASELLAKYYLFKFITAHNATLRNFRQPLCPSLSGERGSSLLPFTFFMRSCVI